MVPAAISPMRAVPASIVRPHYVNSSGPADFDDPIVKDAATIERMRVAGRIAAPPWLRSVGTFTRV
jgi:methionyl aminopeptidase